MDQMDINLQKTNIVKECVEEKSPKKGCKKCATQSEVPTFSFALDSSLENECHNTEFKPEDFLPAKANIDDTGWDIRSRQHVIIPPLHYAFIKTGLYVCSPPGWWLELKPRSSNFFKKFAHCHIGTIDNGFSNELVIGLQYIPDGKKMNPAPLEIKIADRFGQIMPVKLQEMNVNHVSLPELLLMHKAKNSTRNGGFGSTGN